MMLVTGAAACITFFNGYTLWYGLLFWILLGFALLAWLNSHLLYGAFLKIMPSRKEGLRKKQREKTEGKRDKYRGKPALTNSFFYVYNQRYA